jgi:hypothetical protein
MKKFNIVCLSMLLVSVFCTSYIHAQDCSGYYFLQNNKTIERTTYDKDGKPRGKTVIKVSNVASAGTAVSAVINSETFDKNGKAGATATNNVKCADGMLMMDMKMSLPKGSQKQEASGSAEVTGFYIEYPASLNVGDALKDATFTMNSNTAGMDQTTDMLTSNRKVVAKETITSPAGSWECYKITFTSKVTTKMKNLNMNMPAVNIEGTEWFCPGFGIVKTESKGGSTLITSIQ